MRTSSLAAVLAAVVSLLLVQPPTAVAAGESTLVADPLSTWQVSGKVWSLAYDGGHNVVYAGGTFESVRPPGAAAGTGETSRSNIAAFNATTGELLPCAPRLTAAAGVTASVDALELSADGSTLFIGGRFNAVSGVSASNFVALNTSTCTPRTGYPRFSGMVRAFGVTAGTVYVGGDFLKVNNLPRTRLAAMTPSGGLLAWNPTADKTVQALTVAPNGSRVYAGGSFLSVNGAAIQGIVALNPVSGAVVQSFPGWIDGARETVKALAHDNQYVYLASEGSGAGQFDGRIAADVNTGALHWRDGCTGATQDIEPYRGVLYSASHSHDCSHTPGGFPDYAMDGRQHLLAQSTSDETILPWFPDTDEGVNGVGVGPHALAMAAGTLWVGGTFTTVNKSPQQGLTRLPTGPDTGAPQVTTPTATSPGAGTADITWPASWDRDDGVLTYRLYRDAGKTPVYTVQTDSRYWSRPSMTYRDSGLAAGAHTYKITVSDGINTSIRSQGATVTVP